MNQKSGTKQPPVSKQDHGVLWFMLILTLFCELLFYTWIRVESTQTGFRIAKYRESLTRKNSYNTALNLEKERLNSLERIAKIATSKLKFSMNTSGKIIYLPGEED
jgi:cell division protein FtsL